jgi:polyphosphate kinase
MPANVIEFAKNYFSLRKAEMVEGGRYHNLKDLSSLPNPIKSLTQSPLPPFPHKSFNNTQPIFQIITEKEILLHLPYHSYNYILRFFNEAAIDPFVKEIYVTLYRVAADSHIVNALISAAKNGKKVVVFVELKARFDEANNLKWSKKMKEAGVKIINSIPGLKVHAKTALIKRYENRSDKKGGKEWRNYSFMATGNFNEATGRFYTDHVFYTSRAEFSRELELLFEYLQSRKQPEEYGKIPFKHLLVSQFNMIKRFRELIEREKEHAKAGREGRIVIKMNNLQEKEMITMLYEASNAGVKIDLIVRSICCLMPGVKGQSENITVRRIVDRYLEHARVFVFYNDGQPEYYMGSADWMNRNLHSRIEVCFPVYDKTLCDQLETILQLQLQDNTKAVWLNADPASGSIDNQRIDSTGPPVVAQKSIYEFVKKLGE